MSASESVKTSAERAIAAALLPTAQEHFEMIEAVTGNSPLSVRPAESDQMPGSPVKGLRLTEGIRISKELAKTGIDWLIISDNHCIYGIGANDHDIACFSPYSRAIRDTVSK